MAPASPPPPKYYANANVIEQEWVNRENYIPLGTIKVLRDEVDISPDVWSLPELQTWRTFVPNTVSWEHAATYEQWLRHDVQKALFEAAVLGEYHRLHRSNRVKFEFSTHAQGSDYGTLRVYVLPDDVLRGHIYREHSSHIRYLNDLLRSLDYSKAAWNGNHETGRLNTPSLFPGAYSDDDHQDVSLLWLFNNIPSPRPEPELVTEPHSRNVMENILNGDIPGLLTELYPYQRRSAALMLQKEAQPGRVLDPRFVHIVDQAGEGCYLDPVTGLLLKEPRYYDGISGGILAEEMGSGKTIICLSLILATKNLPTLAPEAYRSGELPVRRRIASLADMSAACATRHGVPWKPYFDMYKTQLGEEFTHCIEALERHPGFYCLPRPESRRRSRNQSFSLAPPPKILLSTGSFVVVPRNLIAQWRQEIRKHTQGLKVLCVVKGVDIPDPTTLVTFDLILFDQNRFEILVRKDNGITDSPLANVHFKRCIVDEGHKLGNSKLSRKSDLLIGLNSLNFGSRWIVTGTPSHGLYGVEPHERLSQAIQSQAANKPGASESSIEMERKDLERIGSIAKLYLKVRPWANVDHIPGDGEDEAEWAVYVMLPKHTSKSRGRAGCLRTTLNQLIIRHQYSEMGDLLPSVNQKTVVLEGSYQDQLSLNIFSTIIIFNSVQSQRTDQDFFFHPKQKRHLLHLVNNLKQASFFGSSFFTFKEIETAVKTAEGFLRDEKAPVSPEDEQLLVQAIQIGHVALGNKLRHMSNQSHEMPVAVKGFPASIGQSWSLDGEEGEAACCSPSMLHALQKLISKSARDPGHLNALLNGQLIHEGIMKRESMFVQDQEATAQEQAKDSVTLAGNTKLGDDSPRKRRSHPVTTKFHADHEMGLGISLGPLEMTKITATVSAKLSYLIDSIIKYQDDEKILVFYEHDNTAWYLAGMLEVLQIQHLIYAKGISAERRAQYVNTFHQSPTFRVLLMDISQAAFGLDMKAASRIYFINPVLNPQVEAQAIGRVRRISQQKPVAVETLVLRHSIDEVILEHRQHMSQAEHRRVKSILDVRPIYNWIKSAKVTPLPQGKIDNMAQMAPLRSTQYLFGRGFGRTLHPDDGIMLDEPTAAAVEVASKHESPPITGGLKRRLEVSPDKSAPAARRVRFG